MGRKQVNLWGYILRRTKHGLDTLPANAKVKLLTPEDTERGIQKGISNEDVFWQTFFDDGYDAIVGTDSHNSRVLDVIVNPKLLSSR